MSCKAFKEKLLLYMKNELSKEDNTQMEQHLSHCLTCHSELQELMNMDAYLLNSIAPETAPRFNGITKQNNRFKYILAAAAMLLIMSIYFLSKYSESAHVNENYVWEETRIFDLHNDYERISYDNQDSFLFDTEITDDDIISNYIYSLNERSNYLTEVKL
jgi:hypothetical protein